LEINKSKTDPDIRLSEPSRQCFLYLQ